MLLHLLATARLSAASDTLKIDINGRDTFELKICDTFLLDVNNGTAPYSFGWTIPRPNNQKAKDNRLTIAAIDSTSDTVYCKITDSDGAEKVKTFIIFKSVNIANRPKFVVKKDTNYMLTINPIGSSIVGPGIVTFKRDSVYSYLNPSCDTCDQKDTIMYALNPKSLPLGKSSYKLYWRNTCKCGGGGSIIYTGDDGFDITIYEEMKLESSMDYTYCEGDYINTSQNDIVVSGGIKPYTYSVDWGILSSGIALPGNHLISFTVTDSIGNIVSGNFQVIVTPHSEIFFPDNNIQLFLNDAPYILTPIIIPGNGTPYFLFFEYHTGISSSGPTFVINPGNYTPGVYNIEVRGIDRCTLPELLTIRILQNIELNDSQNETIELSDFHKGSTYGVKTIHGTSPLTYSWTGLPSNVVKSSDSTFYFNNTSITPGTYNAQVTVTDINGSKVTKSFNIKYYDLSVNTAFPDTILITNAPTSIIAGSAAGITYTVTGNGITQSGNTVTFNPASAGPGTYIITFVVKASTTISRTVTKTITVLPAASCPLALNDIMFQIVHLDSLSPDANLSVHTTCGTKPLTYQWVNIPQIPIITFQPNDSILMLHFDERTDYYSDQISIKVIDANNNSVEKNYQIIFENLVIDTTGLSNTMFVTDSPVTFTTCPIYVQSSYTVTGVGMTKINNNTFTFNPAVAGVGTHDIVYTVTARNGMRSKTITRKITVLPVASCPLSIVGNDREDIIITSEELGIIYNISTSCGERPLTYKWSAIPANVAMHSDSSFHFFDTPIPTGNYSIYVTATDGNGASVSKRFEIQYANLALDTAGIPCIMYVTDAPITFVPGTESNIYSVTGAGITSLGNNQFSFTPATAGVGQYPITFSVTPKYGNPRIITKQVTVLFKCSSFPTVQIDDAKTFEGNAHVFTVQTPVSGNYEWSVPGSSTVVTAHELSATVAGEYSITVTDTKGCKNSDKAVLEVISGVHHSLDGNSERSLCTSDTIHLSLLTSKVDPTMDIRNYDMKIHVDSLEYIGVEYDGFTKDLDQTISVSGFDPDSIYFHSNLNGKLSGEGKLITLLFKAKTARTYNIIVTQSSYNYQSISRGLTADMTVVEPSFNTNFDFTTKSHGNGMYSLVSSTHAPHSSWDIPGKKSIDNQDSVFLFYRTTTTGFVSLILSDDYGCSAKYSEPVVYNGPSKFYSISGTVKAGSNACTSGTTVAYFLLNNRFVALDSSNISNDGTFLNEELPVGIYTIKAIPTLQDYIPTYYFNTTDEGSAHRINLTGNAKSVDINLFKNTTSIIEQTSKINIRPNPLVSKAIISIPDFKGCSVKIKNMLGIEIMNIIPDGNTIELSRDGFIPGVYMVIVEKYNMLIYSKKLIIK